MEISWLSTDHGLAMDYQWIVNRLSIDYPWIINGFCRDNPWMINGWSIDIHWLWIDNPWISVDNPLISGNTFRHHTARHSSWEDFNHTNLDNFSVRIFANFEISRFPSPPPPEFRLYFMLFWEAPYTTKDQFGGSLGHQWSFLRYSVFQWLFQKSPNRET